MKNTNFVSCLCALLVATLLASPVLASSPTQAPKVVVEKTVSVGAEGGNAQVTFTATKGQRLHIALKASSSMEPYGFLERAGSSNGEYRPANERAKKGMNEDDVTISTSGKYSLSLFDGSNAGGTIKVTITELPREEQ